MTILVLSVLAIVFYLVSIRLYSLYFTKRIEIQREPGEFTKAEKVILLSTTKVDVYEVVTQFLNQIKDLKLSNSPVTRCLLISGSHQYSHGASVLTNLKCQQEQFYIDDCKLLGIEAKTKNLVRKGDLPLAVSDIPDICDGASSPCPGSIYDDPEVNQMTFQVLNAALYHKNIDKIVQDIATFAPDVIMIGWCYSQFGDLSLALRRSALFSKMIMTHDLRVVTGKNTAKLDEVQEKLLKEIVDKPVRTNVLVRGGPGSGKTIMIVEGAKVKISKLVEQGTTNLKVIVSSHQVSDEPLLLEKLERDFSACDLREVEVIFSDLPKICREENITTKNPIDKINQVTAKLSEDNPDKMIILIVDEMEPVEEIAMTETRDWGGLEVRENLVWLIALQPMGWWNESVKVPEDSEYVLSRQLIYRYRMSQAIRKFFEFVIIHYFRQCYLNMTSFMTPAEYLPAGPLPIWIEFPNQKFTQENILRRVAKLNEIRGSSVTVMYPNGMKDQKALAFCEMNNWRYQDVMSMYGLEDETIIVLDPVHLSVLDTIPSWEAFKVGLFTIAPEFITRASSKLIMITSVNNNDREKFGALYNIALHIEGLCSDYKECPYLHQEILQKRCWHDVNKIEDFTKTWYDVSDLREIHAQSVVKSSCDFCKVTTLELKSCVCKKVSYCGQDCQKADWKNHKPSCPVFIIREAPGKGFGVFATRKIKIGKKIMEELPLLVLRDRRSGTELYTEDFTKITEDTRAKILKLHDPVDNFKTLTDEQYEIWKNTCSYDIIWELLSKTDEDSTILRIFRDNFFPICTDPSLYDGPEHGLYDEMSFLNHSCIPNAVDSWVKDDLQRKKVFALKTIEKNEEILINYRIGKKMGYGSREFRRNEMLRTNGFLCQCSECSLEGKALEANERLRTEIREKGLEIDHLTQGVEATLENTARALKLTEEKLALVQKLDNRLRLFDELLDACAVASDAQQFRLPVQDLIKSYYSSAQFWAQMFGDRHLHLLPNLIQD